MTRTNLRFSDADIKCALQILAGELLTNKSMFPDVVIPVMTGALFFAADLLREIHPTIDPWVVPIKMSRAASPSDPKKFVAMAPREWPVQVPGGLQNKRLLILDTVFDSGVTIQAVKKILVDRQPRSITVAVLVWKNLQSAVGKPDFYGFDLQGADDYLIGYGLDNNGRQRAERQIYYR